MPTIFASSTEHVDKWFLQQGLNFRYSSVIYLIILCLFVFNSKINEGHFIFKVGQKIGTPIAIAADGTVSENDQKVAQQAGKRTGDDQINGQPVAKKPLQQTNNKPSMLQDPSSMFASKNNSSGNSAAALGTVYPIVSLTPYQNKWTIKVSHIYLPDL